MSYRFLPYTYGSLTLAEINALTGMSDGDTVWNTDWNIAEVYSTNVIGGTNPVGIGGGWTNDQCVLMMGNTGSNLQIGYVVNISSATGNITPASLINIQSYVGVVVRGTQIGDVPAVPVTIAFCGKYDVMVGGGARGDYFVLAATGLAQGGVTTIWSASKLGVGGIMMEGTGLPLVTLRQCEILTPVIL